MDIAPETIEREATLTPAQANLFALPVMGGLVVVCCAAFVGLWGWPAFAASLQRAIAPQLFVPVFVLGVLVHEGLHGVGWKLFGGVPWSAIKFGIVWRALMPYAHCEVPLPAAAYRWGTVLPGLLTGVLPIGLGLALGSGLLLVFGTLLLAAAAGDALVLWAIRGVAGTARLVDHPTKPGCLILKSN